MLTKKISLCVAIVIFILITAACSSEQSNETAKLTDAFELNEIEESVASSSESTGNMENGEAVKKTRAKYDLVRPFRDGIAAAGIGADRWRAGGKWGFIDENNDIIVPIEYDSVGDFSEGLAFVVKDNMSGFIDKTGSLVIPLVYEAITCEAQTYLIDGTPLAASGFYISYFHNGLAVTVKDGKSGLIDKSGKEVVPFIYDSDFYCAEWSDYLPYFNGGLIRLKKNGKYGCLDDTGKIAVPFEYDYVEDYFLGEQALLRVKKDGCWGFVDREGKVAVPLKYDFVAYFSEGLAAVKIGDEGTRTAKWGFVDNTGKLVIPIEYEYIGDQWRGYAAFKNGVTAVKPYGDRLTGDWILLDKTGKEIMPLQEEEVRKLECFLGGTGDW